MSARDPGFADFDFLIGDWNIANDFLKHRLVGSTEWESFPATSRVEKVMPDPDGNFCGNLDQMFVPSSSGVNGRGFTGMTLRLYDPATKLWSIYWSDTKSFRLFPPTIGRFENGRGEFVGDDVEGGKPVRVRLPLDGRREPAVGAGDVGRWRGDVGGELGDAV